MLLICSISNEIPEVPVLNRFSGHAYERRLIDEYLTTSDLNPVTGILFSREVLSTLKSQVGILSHIVSPQAAQFDKSEAGKTLRWMDMLNASVPSRIKTALDKIPTNIQECSMDEYHNFLFDGLVLGYLMAALGSGHSEQSNGKAWTNSDANILILNQVTSTHLNQFNKKSQLDLSIGVLPQLRCLCILVGLVAVDNKLIKRMMEFTNIY